MQNRKNYGIDFSSKLSIGVNVIPRASATGSSVQQFL
jgi:hypothetical protein